MKSIVWLASYPKSGNTWLRMFLANYLTNATEPVPLAKAHQLSLGDAMPQLYAMVAKGRVDPRNEAEILALRPAVLRAIVANKADINLVKTHCRNFTLKGVEMIPPALTRLGLYVVRNPLDMMVSYAHHYGCTIPVAAEAISARSNLIKANDRTTLQYPGSWSDHVSGWTRTRAFPVCTLRYEDMISDPEGSFSKVLKAMGAPVDAERLDRSIEFSSFDALRGQEDAHGFVEKSRHADHFFRSGEVGQWQHDVPPDVVDFIRERHGPVMRRHGYLA